MKIDHPPFPPVHAGGPARNDPPASTGDDESFTTTGTAPSEGPGKSSASPAFLARQAVIDDPELANLPFGHVVSQIAQGVFEASVGEGDGTTEGDDTTQSTGDTAPTDGTGDDEGTTGDGETADGTGDDGETTGDTDGGDTASGDTDGDGTASGDTDGDTTTVSSEAADGLIAELLEELDDETDEEIT